MIPFDRIVLLFADRVSHAPLVGRETEIEKSKQKLASEKQVSATKVARLSRKADEQIRLNEERFAAQK
jgi:hypothetical protein